MTSDRRKRQSRTEKQRPFPWRCSECGQTDVVPKTTPYTAEVKHDGRLHTIEIPELEIPTCRSCGARVFTNCVDDQISKALRAHLRLLTPEQILAAIKQLGMSQKDVAERVGIAEATISRWVNGLLIQSRALDNLLRVYFACSDARGMLLGAEQDPDLGATLGYETVRREADAPKNPEQGAMRLRNPEQVFSEVERVHGLAAVAAYSRSVSKRRQLMAVGR